MKIIHLFLFQIFLVTTYTSQAQVSSWELYGQGNGKEVRLFWTASEWNDTIQGFHIKRRIAGGGWVKLTSSLVYPLISATKNLNNVSNDPVVIDRLKKEISASPADFSGTDSVTFMEAIKARGGLAMLTYALSRDYNKALITGLAFYDKKINTTKEKLIEYGLFSVDQNGKTSGPISTFKWKFGEKPNYKIEATSSVRAIKIRDEIRIEWKIKSSTYLDEKVLAGFHIDRVDNSNRTRLTSKPIMPSTREEFITIFQYDDPDNRKYMYELIPVSVMGYESLPYKALYDPALIPDDFSVILISNYKDGDTSISFTIQVPEEKEKFIESFELEEKIGVVDYISLLGPFIGKKDVCLPYDTSRHARYRFEFRLKVNLKDDYPSLFSNTVKVNYFPIIAPKVTGVKAELIKENNKYFARLTWNKAPEATEYHIYTKASDRDEMIGEGSLPTITGNEYLFPLDYKGYKTYTFAVAGRGKVGETMGELSDTVNVTTPTQFLLQVGIVEHSQDEGNKVLIGWKYNEPADLKGYRLFENDQMVADEKVLQKGIFQWKSEPRQPGTYEYTIEAVSDFGIVSIRSSSRTVIVK